MTNQTFTNKVALVVETEKKTAIIFCIYILCTCHDANSIQILNFQDKLQ